MRCGVLLGLLAVLGIPALLSAQTLKLVDQGKQQVIVATDLPAPVLQELGQRQPTEEDWQKWFAVRPASVDATVPPMLGSWQIRDGQVVFTPRFPLRAGATYRVQFEIASGGQTYRATQNLTLPAPPERPAARVVQVYPSKHVLPENQLKFYFHFSAPMSRGEAYRRIHLLDSKGKEVADPFLELDEELWDPRGQRFTLFIDPGRIKRGLKPREDIGPSLEEGKSYTLIVDKDFADAEGRPLAAGYRKEFRVGPPDEHCPDIKTWRLESPAAGTTAPLTLTFPESLDHALLERLLTVVNDRDQKVTGTVRISREETRWQFTPAQPWQAGNYQIVIETVLEDLAGNSLAKPFEVDVFQKIDRATRSERVRLPFQINSQKNEQPIK